MFPVAAATRAVPTIGAIAVRTPRRLSTSRPTKLPAPRLSAYETGGRVDGDERRDTHEHERLEVEAR